MYFKPIMLENTHWNQMQTWLLRTMRIWKKIGCGGLISTRQFSFKFLSCLYLLPLIAFYSSRKSSVLCAKCERLGQFALSALCFPPFEWTHVLGQLAFRLPLVILQSNEYRERKRGRGYGGGRERVCARLRWAGFFWSSTCQFVSDLCMFEFTTFKYLVFLQLRQLMSCLSMNGFTPHSTSDACNAMNNPFKLICLLLSRFLILLHVP